MILLQIEPLLFLVLAVIVIHTDRMFNYRIGRRRVTSGHSSLEDRRIAKTSPT